MKIKSSFVLRKVAGVWTVIPLADKTLSFDGMITMNESGVLLWNRLVEGCSTQDLVNVLTGTYDVTADEAAADVASFVDKLRSCGCLEE